MNILFVCTGNTCRSPMAQAILEAKHISGVNVKSAGLYTDSSPISDKSRDVLLEIGIDYSTYISRQLTIDDIEWADKIYCLSYSHLNALKSTDKAVLLGNGISDPFGADTGVYRACRDEIAREIDKICDFQIKKADINDLPFIEKLEQECFSTPWSLNALQESFDNNTVFFVCHQFDTAVGYCGLSCVLDEGYITNLAVTKDRRKAGIGSALINAVINYAKDKNFAFVTLEVRNSNTAAQNLYKKQGFIQVGFRKNFYTNPTEDAILLSVNFN